MSLTLLTVVCIVNIIRGERPGESREEGPNDGNDTGEEMIVGK